MLSKLLPNRREDGFTITEIVMVVAIFAILAAIATPLYLNQRNSINDTKLEAELLNASIALEESKVDNGGKYPMLAGVPNAAKVSSIDGAEFRYTHPFNRLDYCLQIVAGSQTLFKSSNEAQPSTTDCTYEYVVPSTKLAGHMGGANGKAPVLSWTAVANATSYQIYKNNIKVHTVTVPAGSSAKSHSWTGPAMTSKENASFHVIVGNGGTLSAQSNTVRLTAPVDAPKTPTIRLIAQTPKDSTTMTFTVGWNGVRDAEWYQVYKRTTTGTQLLATLGPDAGTYDVEIPRGTEATVFVRAGNTSGTSGDSEDLKISSEWDDAKITYSASSHIDGRMTFRFADIVNEQWKPDYGQPDARVRLRIWEKATNALVYDVSNISKMDHTTTKAFRRIPHTASIIVTTSTGKVLAESPRVDIDYPKPTAPLAPTNVTTDRNGTASLSPNRIIWKPSVCNIDETHVEYLITHEGNNSGWIRGDSFNIPQSWLAPGAVENFTIVARCSNGNGVSPLSPVVNLSFTTGLITPETPSGIEVSNDGRTVTWDPVVCAAGTTVQYSVKMFKLNSEDVQTQQDGITQTTYRPTGIRNGNDHAISIAARCVNSTGGSSSWSAYSDPFEWTTPYDKPTPPILSQVSKNYISNTEVEYKIRWNQVDQADEYLLYQEESGSVVSEFADNISETTIVLERGTSDSYYVTAGNPNYESDKSNILQLTDQWPELKILSAVPNTYDGTIEVTFAKFENGKWTPDFGGEDAIFSVTAVNTVTGEVSGGVNELQGKTKALIDFGMASRNPQRVKASVLTSTGVLIESNDVTVTFPPPGPPAAPKQVSMSSDGNGAHTPNRINWEGVSCGVDGTASYLISDANGGNSGWVSGTKGSSVSELYYEVPASWLRQGFTEELSIVARCTIGAAGTSASSASTSVKFDVDINTPAAPKVANDGTDLVSWGHMTAPTGLSREYKVTQTLHDGVASTRSWTTTNNTYRIPSLGPNKTQRVTVQVRYYNTSPNISSAWSPVGSTEWITPKPKPGIPVISLKDSKVKNSTEHTYTIGWNAVSWGEKYNVFNADTGMLIGTTTGLTYDVVLTRGIAPTKVYVVAENTSATGDRSNILTLHEPWTTPSMKTVSPNRDGTVDLVWQTGTVASPTPDWGSPDHSIIVTVREGATNGTIVATKSGLTSLGTDIMVAPTSAERNKTYYVTITVTTSTGVTMTAPWSTIKFERPTQPALAPNVRVDNGGVTAVKPDRILWNPVTCSTPNTRAEYWVGYVEASIPTGTKVSGWTGLRSWSSNAGPVNIPASKLNGMQGEDIAMIVLTRCVFNDTGDTANYRIPVAGGDGYVKWTLGLAPPTTNPGTPTRTNVTNNVISWSGAVCGPGTSPQYRLAHTVKNGVSSSDVYTQTALSRNMDSVITDAQNQSFAVSARCVKDTDSSKVSAWGPYSQTYSYLSPMAKPSAPAISATNMSYPSGTMARTIVTWPAVANAQEYVVYDGSTVVATLNSSTRSYTVDITRGSTPSLAANTKNITVKAGNFTYPASGNAASNKLTLSSAYPAAKVSSASADQARKATIAWQTGSGATRNPNWGNDASSVVVRVETSAGVMVHTSPAQSGNSYVTPILPNDTQNFRARITVTTANGETLTSPYVSFTVTPPAAPSGPPATFTSSDGNGPKDPSRLAWSAVTCPTSGSSPRYYITHTDATFGSQNSGWVTGTTYNVPQSWLEGARQQAYSIVAHCNSAAGSSAQTSARAHTSDYVNILAPSAPSSLTLSSVNSTNQTATATWAPVVCESHLTAGYQVVYSERNGASSTSVAYSGTGTSATLTGLTRGTQSTVYVQARCYEGSRTSPWSGNSVARSVKMPHLLAGTVTLSKSATTIDPANEAKARVTLSWTAASNAVGYTLYKGNGTLVADLGNQRTYVLSVDRGLSENYYVRAKNGDGIHGSNSNVVNVTTDWPPVNLVQTSFSSTTGAWGMKWADTGNTWGSSGSYNLTVKHNQSGVTVSDEGLSAGVISRSVTLPSNRSGSFTATITVTTASGSKLTDSITVEYVPRPSTPTGLKYNGTTTLSWNAVSCVSPSTPRYVVRWTKNGGAVETHTGLTTTSLTLSGISVGTGQSATVAAYCYDGNVGADSAESAQSARLSFNYYPKPTSAPNPTNVRMTSGGTASGYDLNRVSWTGVTCPAGSSVRYTVLHDGRSGVSYGPYTRYTGSLTYWDIPASHLQQGRSERYSVQAECYNDNGSASSSKISTGYTVQPIDSPPAAPVASHMDQMRVGWSNFTCPTGTQKQVQWVSVLVDGVAMTRTTPWRDTSGAQPALDSPFILFEEVPEASYGMNQAGYIYARCFYDNTSGTDGTSSVVMSPKLGPWIPEIGSAFMSITSLAWSASGKNGHVTASMTCRYGTYANMAAKYYNSSGLLGTYWAAGGRQRSTGTSISFTSTFSNTSVTRVTVVGYCGASDSSRSSSVDVTRYK